MEVHNRDTFSPHTGFRRTPMGSSLAYMSVYLSLCLSLCLYVWSFTWIFGDNNIAALNCENRMRLQATGSNRLIGSIICLYVHPSSRPRAYCNFFICINLQFRGSESRCIYPHTGVQNTPVGSSRTYMSICLSVCVNVW